MGHGRIAHREGLVIFLLAMAACSRSQPDVGPPDSYTGVGPDATSAQSASSAPPPSAAAGPDQTEAARTPVVTPVGNSSKVDVMLPGLGVTLECPKALAEQREADKVASSDRAAWISFAEIPAAATLSTLWDDAIKAAPDSGTTITYKQKGQGWFVVSGHTGDDIYYAKMAKFGDRFVRFWMQFPASHKAKYEPSIASIAGSFRKIGAPKRQKSCFEKCEEECAPDRGPCYRDCTLEKCY